MGHCKEFHTCTLNHNHSKVSENNRMGKPLSRPDCLRQNPRCLGKGDEDEAYIEDCYVPQRSIYDTMRINEQIDQGTKLSQPSRSTLGSGGESRGEGSTLSSNGTIGADLGGVFVSRNTDNAGVKKLDERVIFDALKLTGDPQSMSPPVGIVSSGLPIAPSSSGSVGVSAVAKRRHQGSDKKDNPNRRSWKAFMPPSYPEFAERLEFSSVDGAEKRLSGAGITLSPLQPPPPHFTPSTPTSSTPPLPAYTPSPLSSAPHTPPVSSSPSLTPTVSPVPPLQQHPLTRQKQLHSLLQKQHKQAHALPSPSKEQSPSFSQAQAHQGSGNTPQHSPSVTRHAERRKEEHRRTAISSKVGIKQIPEEPVESVKTSDSERDSPLLDQDQGDNAPLIPPKPVFCPPTKARTWPRSMTTGKRTQVGLRHNFPVLPPLPPLMGEDNNMDEDTLYLLDPPSPFLQEEEGLVYGGLPLSPCISQEGGDEGLLGWCAQGGELRRRTASELKFEEDERRILEELEEEEQGECREIVEEEAWKKERDKAEEERAQREEREWEAVLRLENREIIDHPWDRETLDSEGWDLTGSSGHWPVLTPPTGFGGPGAPSVSPCPSSGAGSDDLFLELEKQCQEEEGVEGEEMSVDPEPLDPYSLACVEEDEEDREERSNSVSGDIEGTLPLDAVNRVEPDRTESGSEETTNYPNANDSEHTGQPQIPHFDLMRDHENEHGFIDEQCDIDCDEHTAIGDEEEQSYPTYSVVGPHLESDSSGVHMSQPDRTGISDLTQTDCEQERPTQTETDLDSGASSGPDGEDGENSEEEHKVIQKDTSPFPSPLNPYAAEVDIEEEKEELKEEEELGTEWDEYDQSEPSLDGSEGALMDPSVEPLHTVKKDTDNECSQDVLISCEDSPVPSEISDAATGICCDTEAASQTQSIVVPVDVESEVDTSGQDQNLGTAKEMTSSAPESDPGPPLLPPLTDSAPPFPAPLSPSKPSSQCAGLDSKDSEPFVISDSFVYLAVSAPPQYPNDCPPSPLEESIPPSPVSKPPSCPDLEEEGAFLCPDSFVYLAAPERPQPGHSDVSSACEDVQELDMDSYSEGTQSGMDAVDFVLGSMTGDSDWESDGSALDPPALIARDQDWDQFEPGLLQGLFLQMETSQAQAFSAQGDVPQTGATACDTETLTQLEKGSEAGNEPTTTLPCSDTDTQTEV